MRLVAGVPVLSPGDPRPSRCSACGGSVYAGLDELVCFWCGRAVAYLAPTSAADRYRVDLGLLEEAFLALDSDSDRRAELLEQRGGARQPSQAERVSGVAWRLLVELMEAPWPLTALDCGRLGGYTEARLWLVKQALETLVERGAVVRTEAGYSYETAYVVVL